MNLTSLILDPHADIDAIAAQLDGLSPNTRATAARSLGPDAQRRLWQLCRGRAASLADFVPADRAPLETVIHTGRNTLPAFREFEKRFCRPPAGQDDGVLWGFNEGKTRCVVGPGYFVVRETPGDSRGEVVIDYERLPPDRPPEWPAIESNESLRARFVYGYMHDFMRRVSAHVTIGRAYRHDRETPNCFTLCRDR